jgi:competence protein ComEC
MRTRRIDPIAEQLKRLDEQLEPASSPIQMILTTCPAVIPAFGFILGISLRQNCPLSWQWPLAVAIMTLLAGLVCFRIQSILRRAYFATLILFLMFACMGMLRLEYFYAPWPDDARHLLRPQPYPATLRGTIVGDIFKENRKGWLFGGYQFTPPRRSFYLSLEAYQTETGCWQAAKGIIRVQINEPASHIQTADCVRMYCILSGFEGPANPGQFDFQEAMLRRGVRVGASVETADGITVLSRPNGWSFRRTKVWLKNLAWKALLDEIPDETDQRTAMATALLLGYQKTIDAPTNEAFIKTGLSHIISLSGMHMAIIAAMIWTMARLTGMEKRKRAILTFIIITLYAMVVPPQPPTQRAVFIFWFFCAAIWFRRSPRPINTLAVTSIVLLLYRPMDLFRADWQLSYGTLFGILLFYKPIKHFISRFTLEPLAVLPTDNRWTNSLYFIVQILVEVFAAGFAAWAGGAGILLWHFGAVVPACPLWTAIISPIVPVILYLGFFKILLAGLFPTFSALLGWVIIWCSDIFASAVRFFALIDFTSIRLGTVPGWIPIMYYLLIFLWFCRTRIRPAWVKIGTILLSAVIIAGLLSHQSRQKGYLSLTCLSVGHGQAIVLSTPDKKTYLFDAGSITNKDPGNRAIIPYLKYHGIHSLDAAFISHGDLDHYNALPEIAAAGLVNTIYVNAGFLDRAKTGGAPALLTDTLLGKYNVSIKSINDFPSPRGPVAIGTIWPPTNEPNEVLSENDRSEVFLITCAGKTILLFGDIEARAQQKILDLYPDLKADVLILPHHGSTTNLSDQFVRRFADGIVIASCAASRLPGAYKPAYSAETPLSMGGSDRGEAEVDENADTALKPKAFYTGRDGAIEVKIKADGTISAAGFINRK